MTQTYGWFCPECNVRYRSSVCKNNQCPNEHSLQQAFWVYVKTCADHFEVVIRGQELVLNEFVEFEDYLLRYAKLNTWIKRQNALYPQYKAVFENVRKPSHQYAIRQVYEHV